jgi:hypothetical protein
MTPDVPRRIPPDISATLADIDSHVGAVAARHPAGSDLHVLAHAVHNLTMAIRKLHASS